MTRSTHATVVDELQQLARSAPPGLEEEILSALKLGDGADRIAGPAGELWIVHTNHGVSGVVPVSAAPDLAAVAARIGRPVTMRRMPKTLAVSVARALRTGKLGRLPLDVRHLTEFQQLVLRKAAEIPPGQMRSYRWVASEIGRPRAVRAVGSALASNPIPIVLPCHRVSRSDGSVGNYAFGPPMKRAILAAEGADLSEIDDAVRRRVRYVGSVSTDVYCHPTCDHARRIRQDNRIEFRSDAEAVEAGKRPCLRCRPVAA